MNKQFLILLFFALAAYGQQTSVAVLPSEGAALINNDENEALTDEMRKAALKVLPTNIFSLLSQNAVVKRLGGAENYIKECSENSCIVNLGKKAQVDYIAQASVGKLGDKIRLKAELHNVQTEGLVGMFIDNAENISDLLAIVEKRAPAEVFGKIPGASRGSKASPLVPGGISGLEKAADYDFDYDEKRYLTYLSTEPSGAILSFDGVPDDRCAKTPCKAELPEGSVRIIAALEHYEKADTTISIKQNNQNINIKLKPNFGVLEINPAYSDGIGKDAQWNLSINDKPYSLGEIRFSPGNYDVKLSHECYEDISFKAGINKGRREVFDMASNMVLKKGGLVLSTEADDEPVSEPVFVNGRHVGETPFSGSVPLCARIEVGRGREAVNARIKHNVAGKYVHRMNTEERRRRLAEEQRARQEAAQRELERQEKEREEREKLALLKGPHWVFTGGFTFMMKYIHPAYENNGFFLNFNPEFASVANGHLHFGVDADVGIVHIDKDKVYFSNEQDSTVLWFRGGALTKLYFFDGMVGPYLTAGAGWYVDGGNSGIDSYSGPSFSVGAGFYLIIVVDARYFVMPTDGRNAGYIALSIGFSFPHGITEKK
jgi:TolB-like protein